MGVAQNAVVGTGAPRGAALDFHLRVRLTQTCEQRIERLYLSVRCRHAATLAGLGRGVGEVAIHVPLEIADRVVAEQGIQSRKQIVSDVRACEIQHALIPPQRLLTAFQRQYPVGMRAKERAVRIDHLGFHPQTEFHALGMDGRDQWPQPLGVFALIQVPITQRCSLTIAAHEPAIVEHEAFRSDVASSGDQLLQTPGIVIEIEGLPGVDVDRARLVRRRPVKSCTQGTMHALTGAIDARVRPRHDDFRRGDAVPGGQYLLTGQQ